MKKTDEDPLNAPSCIVIAVPFIMCFQIRDGADENANFVGRYCGNSTPPAFVSSSNTLWVKFRSDMSNRGAGFRALWSVG
jgi:CUB domain